MTQDDYAALFRAPGWDLVDPTVADTDTMPCVPQACPPFQEADLRVTHLWDDELGWVEQ